jgi:chromosome partitioning protein
MGKIVTIANEKGGVGKTALSVNLGAALSIIRSQRVLIVDMDPQGNASYILSKNAHNERPSMYDVLTDKDRKLFSIIEETTTEGLDLAPGNLQLAGAEIQLIQTYGREFALKRSFTPEVIETYDYIFIDTAPSLSLLTINSFVAADYILIPVFSDFLSLVGLNLLLDTINLSQENLGSNAEVIGFIITKYDCRENISDEAINLLRAKFGSLVYEQVIRTNVKLKEAPSKKQTIFQYDPVCIGARNYLALANEFLSKMDKRNG